MIVQKNDSCRQKWISDPKTELYIIIYHVDTQKTPFYTENHAQMASGRPPGAKNVKITIFLAENVMAKWVYDAVSG